MKTFHYKAKESPQKIVEGEIEAQNRDQVVAELARQGLFPLEIVPQARQKSQARFPALLSRRAPTFREKIAFLDQLADLLSAGLTLVRALELAAEQYRKESWARLLTDLKEAIRAGKSFSDSLMKHSGTFSKFIVSMIRAGEQSGALETSLRSTAQAMEREADLRAKITQSLIYPAIIVSFGIVTIIVLLTFVIPRLEELYRDLGGSLPLLTRIVSGTSRLILSYWWLIGLSCVALFLACGIYMKRAGLSARSLSKNVPWVGVLVHLEETIVFTRSLGLLLKSGIPIIEALTVAEDIVQERRFRSDIAQIRKSVVQGSAMAATMETLGTFTPLVVSFIRTGEETGTLDSALDKVSRIYDKEIDQRIKILTTLLEPLLILAVGIVVGILVVSMLLPIFEISFLIQ